MLEKRIEDYLGEQVRLRDGLAVKLGLNGWPDRMVLLPPTYPTLPLTPGTGLVGFCELKRPGGKASALQAWRLGKLASLGFVAELCETFSEVDAFLARVESRSLVHYG